MQTVNGDTLDIGVSGDYRYALLHLAWYREGRTRWLLFGMVELFPAEMPAPDPTEEQCHAVRSQGRQHAIYVRRIGMSAEDALAWYESSRVGQVVLPEEGHEVKTLEVSHFSEEPPWPHHLSTSRLPFHCWGTVRAHHLLQGTPPDRARLPLTNAGALHWLGERLFFDLMAHPEWLGSVSLIAPDPVLRGIHHTLGVGGAEERSDIHLITRQGHSVKGLLLHLGEHKHGGVANFHTVSLEQPYLRIPHVGRTEQISLAVVCPKRGVLEWHDPLGFLRSIGLSGGISRAIKTVTVPNSAGRPGETYTQTVVDLGFDQVIGDQDNGGIVAPFLHAAQRQRDRRAEAERLGQKLFHGNQQEAREFVRSLIAHARNRVIIVDPYFATAELFAFALATSRSEVKVTILTSAEHLRDQDKTVPDQESGVVLLRQLERLQRHGRFEVKVMGGKRADIHDRFLIIDDAVWLSGNSLHTIGDRAGMMIQIPAPEEVQALVNTILVASTTLALKLWVEARIAAQRTAEREPLPDE